MSIQDPGYRPSGWGTAGDHEGRIRKLEAVDPCECPGATDYALGVLAEGTHLKAYWKMSEASGNQLDYSGNGHDLVHTAGTTPGTYDVPGALPVGQDDGAFQFNYNETAEFPSNATPFGDLYDVSSSVWEFAGTVPFTIEGFIKPTAGWSLPANEVTFFGTRSTVLGENPGWGFGLDYTYGLAFYRAGVAVSLAGALSAGTAYHIAASYDGASLRLYVNGILVSTVATVVALVGVTGQALRVGYGRHSGAIAGSDVRRYLYGMLDELAIYDVALSSATILEHALNAQLPGTAGPLVVYENGVSGIASSAINFKDGVKSTVDVVANTGLGGVDVTVEAIVTDANMVTSDVTTNNASTSKHGFLKKLSNVASEVMNGVGNWVGIGTIAVASIKKTGSAALVGDVTLTGGSNVTLTQSGQDITIAATVVGGGAVDSIAASGDTPMIGNIEIAAGSGISVSQDDVDTITIAATGGASDGWISPGHTLVYVSATTVKVTGADVTAFYPVGRRVRFKQGGGYKYFVVTAAPTFSTDTTITLSGGSDYTVANAAITDNYVSPAESPDGYPAWFNYAVTPTGFSGTPTTTGRFQIVNGWCHFYVTIDGTSNSTSFGFSLPVAAVQGGPAFGANVYDGGVAQSTFGYGIYVGGSATIALRKTLTGATTAWTNSAGKGAYMEGSYPIS